MSMLLSPRIVPGSLHAANKSACHWGWQGYIAYGCQNYVVVVDSKTVQVVQTLQMHSSPICEVKWCQENYHHDYHTPYDLKLAAANIAGHILIWDIREGKLLNDFVEPNRLPVCMEWLAGHETSHDLLLALYSPNVMVLWNADTSVRLWKKTFTDTIVQMALDPFKVSNMTVMSTDWIMLITDLSLNQPPSEKGRKFYMSNASPTSSSSSLSASSNSLASKGVTNQTRSTIQRIKSAYGDLRGGKSEEEIESNCDCLQVVYLRANRSHVMLLFPREILILDMDIGQALGSFSIENNSPSFQAVFPCRQRDVLFLLHENGSISLRAVRSPPAVPYEENDDPEKMLTQRISMDILYDIKCHSDVFRLSRASRLMGFCVDPVYECHNAIILGDGRILFWSLAPPSGASSFLRESVKWKTLPELEQIDRYTEDGDQISLNEMIPCLMSFGDDKEKAKYFKPKFMLEGMFESIALNPVCCRMCPPMTTRNFSSYKPLLAVGCSSGALQIFNLSKGCLIKHITMATHSIKGLEWMSLTTLLVWFYGSSTNNKSEICHVDIVTGLSRILPSSRGLKESTVASLKVSQLKNYFLVLFKDNMAELWDATQLCQLREFPRNFPTITAFGWSPASYSSKFGKRKNKSNAPKDAASTADVAESLSSKVLDGSMDKEAAKKLAKMKEHLVFTDTDGTVYHYVVEGTSLKDGSKVPPEAGMSAVSFITWKQEVLVLGDVDGNVNFWDLKAKVSRVLPTNRGAIRRLKFAPGKGNMRILVMFNDGVDVWDTTEAKCMASIKTNKDGITILDADWLSSSLPVLLLSDGSIRVMDPLLKSANSPVNEKDIDERLFNPRLLDPVVSLKMKSMLQHQKWRDEFNPKMYSETREESSSSPIQDLMDSMPDDQCRRLKQCPLGTAERCGRVAQIYGDESDLVFWNVALHNLEKAKLKIQLKAPGTASPPLHKRKKSISLEDFDLDLDLDNSSGSSSEGESSKIVNQTDDVIIQNTFVCTELDSAYDILCDNEFYKRMQLYRIALRDSHRSTYEHTRSCAENLILLGQMDRAVQILLEGEPSDDSYYPDALRACLIATVKTTSASQSTIKLVATNLIACGKLKEGVELLCLVDKGTDACRYLQTYGAWDLATWIAKVRLNHRDCTEVMSRWCEQLSSVMNKKMDAVLILLSLGQFVKVLELLFKLGQIERAVLLLESCVEFGLFSLNDDQHCNLFENILLDYARLQRKLNNEPAVEYYCKLAGGRGKKLLEEYEAEKTIH